MEYIVLTPTLPAQCLLNSTCSRRTTLIHKYSVYLGCCPTPGESCDNIIYTIIQYSSHNLLSDSFHETIRIVISQSASKVHISCESTAAVNQCCVFYGFNTWPNLFFSIIYILYTRIWNSERLIWNT